MKCICNEITPVTVIEDLQDLFTNSNHDVFDESTFNNIKNFEWYKTGIFYIILLFTVAFIGIGIWGYFKDRSDVLKVIPVKKVEIEEI
jgi:Tfp pilus assembly protein PilO